MVKGRRGEAVDAEGGPVIDPTQNVLDLVQAAIQRQDDLREAETRHLREILEMRSKHYEELRLAEAQRIDAIRAVDVAAVQRASEVSAQQALTLASQVQTTANSASAALSAALDPIHKDIADLRRAQYEAQGGKTQTVEARATTGESRMNVGVVVGIAGALFALAGVMCSGLAIAVGIVVAFTR